MGTYRAPLEDMCFIIDELLDAEGTLGSLPLYAEDEHPATCSDGKITVSPGYDDAIRQFAAGGWVGIAADINYGGQGLPELYSTAGHEMWNSANIALALAPLLSSSAALAIAARFRPGCDEGQGGAGGRSLPHLRPEDLHHLG
jgi:alkylation response protein AidB-like acyl-CoA dehydrogenase